MDEHWNKMHQKPVSDSEDIKMIIRIRDKETIQKSIYEDIFYLYKKYFKPEQKYYVTECEGCSSSIYTMYNWVIDRLIIPEDDIYEEYKNLIKTLKEDENNKNK